MSSCSKNEQVDIVEDKVLTEYDNPYQELGLIHNDILADVMKNTHSFKSIGSKNEVAFAVNQACIKYRKSGANRFNDSPDLDSLSQFVNLVDNDLMVMVNNLYINNYINNIVKEKIVNLVTIINNFDTNTSFDQAYNCILKFEWEIVNDSSLNIKDKNNMLKVVAVFKESSKFWYQNKDLFSSNTRFNWSAFRCILATAAGDAMGIIAGPVVSVAGSVACYLASGYAETH